MGYYEDVYLKRLNRYGNNYQERILTQRREVFARRLLKSVYRIDFNYKDQTGATQSISATFERYKQDNTQTLRYLLTAYDVVIPNGTLLFLPDPIGLIDETEVQNKVDKGPYPEAKNNSIEYYDETLKDKVQYPYLREEVIDRINEEDVVRPWMVYYLEDSGAKGYNRYIMLRMTHYLEWKDRDKIDRWSYAYMYGQENNMLKDEIRSRSRMDPIYAENLKMSFFVMPANEFVRKDDYFIIDKEKNHKVLDEFYRVTGYDMQSQDGVEYVTIDPVYEFARDYHEDVPTDKIGITCQHQFDDWGKCIKCGYRKETQVTDFTPQVEENNAGFWLMGQIKEE